MVCVEYKQCLEIRLRGKRELDAACVLGTKLRSRGLFEGSWLDSAGMQSRGSLTSQGP